MLEAYQNPHPVLQLNVGEGDGSDALHAQPNSCCGLSGLGCRPGADRSLTFAARIFGVGFLHPFSTAAYYPSRWNCLNPSRERKRAVSSALATLPLSVRIPRANIVAPSEAVTLRVGFAAAAAQGFSGLDAARGKMAGKDARPTGINLLDARLDRLLGRPRVNQSSRKPISTGTRKRYLPQAPVGPARHSPVAGS